MPYASLEFNSSCGICVAVLKLLAAKAISCTSLMLQMHDAANLSIMLPQQALNYMYPGLEVSSSDRVYHA